MFERWESGSEAALQAPLSMLDARYRQLVLDTLEELWPRRPVELVSVGAGSGVLEEQMMKRGWNVLATDPTESALECCRQRGLATTGFTLLGGNDLGSHFDVIYCDGVFGHLWLPGSGCQAAWRDLARLGRPGSIALVSNDLSNTDDRADFAVRSAPDARFYRPPCGRFALDAAATGLWAKQRERVYEYRRGETARRREIVVAQLLVNEGVEAQDRA